MQGTAADGDPGWNLSRTTWLLTGPLMTTGLLQVRLPLREKLRKIRVALDGGPPIPPGRSFHAAYSTPWLSIVVDGNSNRRTS